MKNVKFLIQPYTPKELTTIYRCSPKTFSKWMELLKEDLGPRAGHSYSPKQVRMIVKKLGRP